MNWIKTISREVFGLFVDDAAFALAILIWLGVIRWGTPLLGLPAGWTGILLFAGLALILSESALRYARKARVSDK